MVQTPHESDEDAASAADLLLRRTPRPTAVLCFSDLLALQVVRTARRLGLEVPDDVVAALGPWLETAVGQ